MPKLTSVALRDQLGLGKRGGGEPRVASGALALMTNDQIHNGVTIQDREEASDSSALSREPALEFQPHLPAMRPTARYFNHSVPLFPT